MKTLEKRTGETTEESASRPKVSPMWRVLAIALIVLLVVGAVGVAVAMARSDGDAAGFPTGTFVREDGTSNLEFNKDGTGRSCATNGAWEVPFMYAVNGDLYTEMTYEFGGYRKVPATYHWSYDGEHLTFELWGEDLVDVRYDVYSDPSWTKAED